MHAPPTSTWSASYVTEPLQPAQPAPELSFLLVPFQIVPCAIGIFLAAMDGTVVASSYASIGSELKQLQNTSWIATGYMLTLTSFQ